MSLQIPYSRFRLHNGLTVVFHEDRRLPLVSVNLWYGVGSKDERPGRTGFAHLFEHLMFMGTHRVAEGRFDQLMEAEGGSNNATTSEDRTNYFATGPSHILRTLLWLEADRLESLGRAMTQSKLDLQRDVVRNERRQSYENQPYARAWLVLPELLWPKDHPYAHAVIGSHADLEAATVADVQDFFATHYVPSNASLVVAGDFDRAGVEDYVRGLFGTIPDRPRPAPPAPPPARLGTLVHHVQEDDVPAPRVILAWITPAHFAPGDAEMDLIADVLAGGPASRLHQALVVRDRVAQDVAARQDSGQLGSSFTIIATALPGVPPAKLVAAIDAELDRLASSGPSGEEIRRVVVRHEAHVTRELQDLGSRADLLNLYQHILGDPGSLEFDLGRYRQLGPQDLALAQKRYLGPEARVLLEVVPRGTSQPAPLLASGPPIDDPRPWRPPSPGHATLASLGTTFWHHRRKDSGLFALKWILPRGASEDPIGEEGALSLLAELLLEGAGDRDSEQLAAALDGLGAVLRVAAGRHASHIALQGLAPAFAQSLDILADVLLAPRLEARDRERRRSIRLAEIAQRATRPTEVALLVSHRRLRERLGQRSAPVSGDARSVAAIAPSTLRDLAAGLPGLLGRGHLVVAGDLQAGEVEAALLPRFRLAQTGPQGGPPHARAGGTARGLEAILVDRPDSPQTVIRFLRPAPRIDSPLLPALILADHIFGGSFTSRLNRVLREEHGFTYGAGSRLACGREEGTFTLATSVQAATTPAALEVILAELDRLAEGRFTEEELRKGRSAYRADLVRAFEAAGDSVEAYAMIAEGGLGPDALADWLDAIESLGPGPLAEAAALLGRDEGVLVLVGQEALLREAVTKAGLTAVRRADPTGHLLDG
jgi:zinc protease